MDDRIISSEAQQFELMFRRLMCGLHTAAPGIIKAFDGRFATVQPAIKIQTVIDGVASFIDPPLILHVPVVVPHSPCAGLALTVPILPGDECLLIYAERAIDNFVAYGGLQPPILITDQATAQGRTHDITDAICIPGIVTAAHLIPNYSQTSIEIRDTARKTVLSVKRGELRAQDGAASVVLSKGRATVTAPRSADVTAPKVTITGNVTIKGTLSVSGVVTGTGATKGAL